MHDPAPKTRRNADQPTERAPAPGPPDVTEALDPAAPCPAPADPTEQVPQPPANDPAATLPFPAATPPPDALVPTVAFDAAAARAAARAGASRLTWVGREFANFEVLAELGRGGMGVVYRVRQKGLNRTVALKMLLPGALAGPDELRRFQSEAETTAALQHPNIVTIHDVGEFQGCHYYSMDFIEGQSLAHRINKQPLPGRTAARYAETVARAMHHAHRHGVLHRDLKPSNIILDDQDQPHVTDFGLAKRLGDDASHTRTGVVLGTPSYMAPEQAGGRVRECGPPTDVYGLGAVLYEMLTGHPPFQSESTMDTLVQVMERDPVPPTLLNPRVDPDLETICLKCLEKDPANRYPTAEAVADDLRRYLDGDTIQATGVNVLEYISRTLDRSQHMVEFRPWGTMLLQFAAVVGLAHLVMFVVSLFHPPAWVNWLARIAQYLVIGLIFWSNRARRLLPSSTAERQLWAIWVGYFVACLAVALSRFLHGDPDPDGAALYVPWSLLGGLGLFAMGGNYWGRCYALGLAFFALAAVLPFFGQYAPLAFGALWTVALLAMGLHLYRLAADADS